jgi:hypothetical protein
VPLDHNRMTVEELLEELGGCDPAAEVRIAQQPAWPFEYALDTAQAVVAVDLDDSQPVVYLVEGQQLGYLPTQAADRLGWGYQ